MSDLNRARLIAAASIALALVVDLAVKRIFLAHIVAWNFHTLVPGFLDIYYAWNRGVSFSLFWQNSTFGSAVLSAFLMAVIIVLAVSAFRTSQALVAAGMGLIAGGALGNIVDRATQGAVFDFLVVRFGSHPLFVCNSADVFISLGVICLGVDLLFPDLGRKV